MEAETCSQAARWVRKASPSGAPVVAEFMEADEAFVPMEIGFLGADGIATQADGVAEAVGDFLLRHDGAPALTEISAV